MEEALQAVRDGMGVNKAAELHGVPKTTLQDRVSGVLLMAQSQGQYLT